MTGAHTRPPSIMARLRSAAPFCVWWFSACGGGSNAPDTADTADTWGLDDSSWPDSDTSAEITDTWVLEDSSTLDSDLRSEEVVEAVPGLRCELSRWLGGVTLAEWNGDLYASAVVFDRPSPYYGPPALVNGSCALYLDSRDFAACGECQIEEVCERSGRCGPLPLPRKDVALRILSEGGSQGAGRVTLEGETFALELSVGGFRVTLVETAMPAPLVDVTGVIAGGSENPEGVTITWSPVDDHSHVATDVPMNHHVDEETFTSCTVAASSGRLDIAKALVAPLAIDTGLEMQALYHSRFAAAELPFGCIEFRFDRVYRPDFR